MCPDIQLRPILPDDTSLLYRVYASTREDELALVDWSEAQKQAFLQMQFDAQHRYYQEHYASASYSIILADGEPVGRLYVDRRPDEIRIIDIALLPESRNQGMGTWLMRGILDDAARQGVPVRIHVEQFSPALRLYRRLGFHPVEGGESGVYVLMECPLPEPSAGLCHDG